MNASKVATHILMTCPALSEFHAYMFGSSLAGVGSDFDILIIGPSGVALSQLKSEISVAGSMLPLDVLYMLPEEAEETNFVAKQNCIPFEQLCKLNGNMNKHSAIDD
ncbi:nucleotidyltransferase domain-containing protein [Pseudoalteromonas rubra]|nr:nucleotidyltransferase domain-containing protein [Pseudoalteromonas rubra]